MLKDRYNCQWHSEKQVPNSPLEARQDYALRKVTGVAKERRAQ